MKKIFGICVVVLSISSGSAWAQTYEHDDHHLHAPHGEDLGHAVKEPAEAHKRREVTREADGTKSKTLRRKDGSIRKTVDVYQGNKLLGVGRIKMKAKFDKNGNLIKH